MPRAERCITVLQHLSPADYSVARRAGLTDAEAQGVVQETVLTVARRIDGLKYDPALGSFKGWLLNITRWRIADQFRKRQPGESRQAPPRTYNRRTATIERIPGGEDPAAVWDTEWQQNLIEVALDRVKRKVDPKHFQAFHCYAVQGWLAGRVAAELKVNIGHVYLIRHRSRPCSNERCRRWNGREAEQERPYPGCQSRRWRQGCVMARRRGA